MQKHSQKCTLSARVYMQCVTLCCSVWLCVAVCCSELQCVAVCCSQEVHPSLPLHESSTPNHKLLRFLLTATHCSTLQHTATHYDSASVSISSSLSLSSSSIHFSPFFSDFSPHFPPTSSPSSSSLLIFPLLRPFPLVVQGAPSTPTR